MPRLAMVVPDLAVGGLQGMAVGLALALDPAQWPVVFYTFDAGGPLEATLRSHGIRHVHLPRQPGLDVRYARAFATRLHDDGIDLLHCHNITALFHGARAAWLADRLPTLFTEHDREMPAPWRHRLLHRWLARRVTHTVAVSERLASALLRYEGFPPARTGSIVNGIPDPRSSYHGDRAAARTALGWDDRPVVLAVGSLTPVKNQAGLLASMALLSERMGGAPRLVLAGEGPLRAELMASAQRLLPQGDVSFLGNRSDVPRLLAAADVFVLPSHREGLPLSLVEAHAMARPSVAYDVGGNGEVTLPGVTGELVPYPDEDAFARALQGLLQDARRAADMGQAARQRYLACFTHERMVAAYVALYEQLLAVRVS